MKFARANAKPRYYIGSEHVLRCLRPAAEISTKALMSPPAPCEMRSHVCVCVRVKVNARKWTLFYSMYDDGIGCSVCFCCSPQSSVVCGCERLAFTSVNKASMHAHTLPTTRDWNIANRHMAHVPKSPKRQNTEKISLMLSSNSNTSTYRIFVYEHHTRQLASPHYRQWPRVWPQTMTFKLRPISTGENNTIDIFFLLYIIKIGRGI